MPRVCSICTHPERDAIEAAIVAGTSYRVIARQFLVGHDSVQRHAADHIQQSIQQAQEAKEEARGIDVAGQLKRINEVAWSILEETREIAAHDVTLKAMNRVEKQIELQAKLLGELGSQNSTIWKSDEWKTIRETLLRVLMPFPDARIAVASALIALEESHASNN